MGIAERVGRAVDEAISEEQVVGAVVLVYQDGAPLLRKAAGYADREAQIPVSLDTIFRYASVTKPIVAATALAMIEAGSFRTDDAVSDFLPWFRPRTADGREPRITVHHLLTHTSGLVYDAALESLPPERAVSLGLSNTDLTLEENFSRCNAVPLAFEPGGRWAYSHATDILGAFIAAVHGDTLEAAAIHHVTGPLRMDDARFHVTDPKRLSIAYADGMERPVRMPDPWVPAEGAEWRAPFSPGRIFNQKAFQSGGAGMAGTAGDILTLLEAFRQGGSPIVSPETAAAALSNQIGDVAGDPGMRFGYLGGIISDPALAGTCLPAGAIRWGGVYGGTWFIDPARKLTVVNLTNTALEGCMGLYPERIRRAIYVEA
ncbi:CubicO group peptidase (beta-lactamase class C family) [Ciceribacter lividus]|uniref:CubicO group peptidase (Beta-lactamase class C family) n=1 Tax=Ciceribacter lividus TaxID=1197950 RepID=A0A6I7HN99_9HYPH|nr:serine hydrolase domain-containing protein [Ciceribacter lividus]RCW25989.1 CubicO group peptidase (beta-lactamase class C family) [Ciceribacter lividus]